MSKWEIGVYTSNHIPTVNYDENNEEQKINNNRIVFKKNKICIMESKNYSKHKYKRTKSFKYFK